MMTHHNSPRDFLSTWDKDAAFLKNVLELAEVLKMKPFSAAKIFPRELAVSIFRDKSTRTRYSFAQASSMLGLTLFDFDEGKSQIAHGETVEETANMVGFLTRTIGIRDDIFLGVGHQFMIQTAQGFDWGYENKVLPVRPTIVNLQSDEDHPTQSLSDLAHLSQHFGGINKLKGKKITISWAYSPSYGKPLSVPQGAIVLFARFGMDVTLAYPKGYQLIPEIEAYAGKEAEKSGGKFKIVSTMQEAFSAADAVYPKSWASYEVMEKRTQLLKLGKDDELKQLEKQALLQNAKHKSWTCTEKLMQLTHQGKGLYMHCLPADISGVSCKEGEVEKSVFARFRKEVYEQASWKPYIIASMILLCQFGGKYLKLKKKFS